MSWFRIDKRPSLSFTDNVYLSHSLPSIRPAFLLQNLPSCTETAWLALLILHRIRSLLLHLFVRPTISTIVAAAHRVAGSITPLQRYYHLVESGTLRGDEHQTRIIQLLQDLHERLMTYDPPMIPHPSASNSLVSPFSFLLFFLNLSTLLSIAAISPVFTLFSGNPCPTREGSQGFIPLWRRRNGQNNAHGPVLSNTTSLPETQTSCPFSCIYDRRTQARSRSQDRNGPQRWRRSNISRGERSGQRCLRSLFRRVSGETASQIVPHKILNLRFMLPPQGDGYS